MIRKNKISTAEQKIDWLVAHWASLNLNDVKITNETDLNTNYWHVKKRLVASMKRAGLYSKTTSPIDVNLAGGILIASAMVASGQVPPIDPGVETEVTDKLKYLAETKFFTKSEMGWVEREYAIQEAIRFHRAVVEGKYGDT